jgi:hypothetical protein
MERRPTEPSDPGFRPFSYSSWMRFRMRSCDVKVRVGGVESVVGMGSRQISVADRGPRHRKREQTRRRRWMHGHRGGVRTVEDIPRVSVVFLASRF